jgi:hypothetical protein
LRVRIKFMRTLQFIFAALIAITVTDYCAAKEWRGIVPLKSTRADVERLLGPATGPLPTYYLSDVTVTVWYATCACGDTCKTDLWNVSPGTVTGIRVDLKGVVTFADLKIDLTHFKKSRLAEDVPRSFIYSDAEEGLAIEGDDRYVSTLIYGPRTKDAHLRCPHNSADGD